MELIDKKQFDLVNEFYISLRKSFEDLLEENKKLHEDKSKLLKQGLSLVDENQKLKLQNLSLKQTLEHTEWAANVRYENLKNVLYDYLGSVVDEKDIEKIYEKIIELNSF